MATPARRSRKLAVSAVAALAVVAAAAWYRVGGMEPGEPAPAGTEPRPIAGGTFEASGVASVPGTSQLLFVDDGRTRELFVMELANDGSQRGSAQSVALGADVTDLEGITSDGRHFYAVGSQSKKGGLDGDGLVRFTYDPATRRITGLQRVQGLKAWLAANVAELRGTEKRVGDDVLNIEGLAWDPRGQRLLLGLRAPVVNGAALVVPVKLADANAAFTRENLRADGPAIRLQLNGAGIRSLEYDEHAAAFRVITGAGLNEENLDFRILEWDGRSAAPSRELGSYNRRLKPEGITRTTINGKPASVIVFDVGSYVVVD